MSHGLLSSSKPRYLIGQALSMYAEISTILFPSAVLSLIIVFTVFIGYFYHFGSNCDTNLAALSVSGCKNMPVFELVTLARDIPLFIIGVASHTLYPSVCMPLLFYQMSQQV